VPEVIAMSVSESWFRRVALALVSPALSALALAAPAAAHEWGAGLHYSRWDGDYTSQGIGSRFRWEPLSWLGFELTGELLAHEGAFDIPAGFQVYTPLDLGGGVRVRALAGLCTTVSLSRSASVEASAGDDIRMGFRLGGGAEWAIGDVVWLFADAKWERYLGHSRKVSAWSSALDGELGVTDRLALAIGLGVGL